MYTYVDTYFTNQAALVVRDTTYQSLSRVKRPRIKKRKEKKEILNRIRHSIPEHLHVLYENSIVYGDICMYYHISIFQKTAISILDINVGYIVCLLPLRITLFLVSSNSTNR